MNKDEKRPLLPKFIFHRKKSTQCHVTLSLLTFTSDITVIKSPLHHDKERMPLARAEGVHELNSSFQNKLFSIT